jgi:opacity protein-like surface antigen
MNLKITATLAIMTAALAPAAFSQEQTETRGFYVGGGIGQFNAQIDDVDQVDNTIDKWKEDDTAYKFFAGYRMNPYLAFEAAYVNLGKPSGAVVPGFNVDQSVDGFAPYVVGTIPLGKYFELNGRVGYYFYDANLRLESVANGRVQFDEESNALAWGAGIGTNIGEKFNVKLEYERFDIKRLDDADALWLTAAWRF